MELAAMLQPKARDVYVVAGASGFDLSWIDTARRQLADWSDRYAFHYVYDAPMPDVRRRIAGIAPDSIVLALSFFQDSDGRRFIPVEAARLIAASSPAPVYGPYDTYVGAGAVGSFGDTFETTGIALADLVLDMLSDGGSPVGDRVNTDVAFRVDARQLERHGLSRDDLPAGTIVLFDEMTLWDRYWYVVVAVLAVIALQFLLLVTLVAQRAHRRRAEAALRESEERMVVAAESANIGLWHLDSVTGELWLTPHGRKLLRLRAEDALVPADLLAIVHPEDRHLMARAISDLESGTPLSGEFRIVAGDGVLWIQAVGNRVIRNNDHRISGIFKDITARRTAQLEAEAQRRDIAHMSRALVLGELSGAIAHELNQPLAAILANAQAAQVLLRGESPDIAEAQLAIAEIIEDDNRAGEVIQHLRTLLRKDQARWEAIDINDIANATLDLLRSELISRKIETRLALAMPSGTVRGDPVQLQQVLLNLIVNAMDALGRQDPGPRLIAVRTLVPGDGQVAVVVEDSGPGFAPSHQQHLAEPFFTTKPNGLGLGLSICTRIVRMHSGAIAFSESTLGGARVTVTLPEVETRALAAE
jgi:signal transduction histidine kinase